VVYPCASRRDDLEKLLLILLLRLLAEQFNSAMLQAVYAHILIRLLCQCLPVDETILRVLLCLERSYGLKFNLLEERVFAIRSGDQLRTCIPLRCDYVRTIVVQVYLFTQASSFLGAFLS
jgi:hypothetical protein